MKKWTIEQHEEIGKYLKSGFEIIMKRSMISIALRIVNIITTETIPETQPQPVDRGFYRAAWRAKVIENGAEVFNTAPHAGIIEDGVKAENVKPGIAMINALEMWVVRKGIASSDESTQVAKRIAFAMKARGIFNRGKGLRILNKTLTKHANKVVIDEFQRELKRFLAGNGAK